MSDSPNVDKQLNLGAACFRCRGFRYIDRVDEEQKNVN